MNTPLLNILIVEDNPRDARLHVEMMRDVSGFAFEYKVAASLADVESLPKTDRFDVALLDLNLPDSEGMETFYAFCDLMPQTPIIILTGMSEQELGVEAVRHGAQNYLTKGVDGPVLVHSIIYSIERNSLLVKLQLQGRALAESEQKQKLLIENMLEGFWGIDKNGITTLTNPSLCNMLGYTNEELLGKPVIDLVDESLKPTIEALLTGRRSVLSEMQELCFRRKDGSKFHAIFSSAPVFTNRSDFNGVVATLLDYNENHEAQVRQNLFTTIMSILNQPSDWKQALHDILSQIRDFLDVEVVALRYLANYRGKVVYEIREKQIDDKNTITKLCLWSLADQSPHSCKFLCEYLMSQETTLNGCTRTERGSVWCNRMRSAIATLEPVKASVFLNTQCMIDNVESYALLPMYIGDDVIGALAASDSTPDKFSPDVIGFLEKIAETVSLAFHRMKYEEEIIHEQERTKQYMDVAPVLMTALDPQGVVQMVNNAGAVILQREKKEIERHEWFGLVHEELEADRMRQLYAQAMANPQDASQTFWGGFEANIVDSAGEKRLLRWFNRPMLDDDNRITGALCSGLDLTRLRKTEQDLKRSEDHFHKIFHHNPDMTFIVNVATGRIVEANPVTIEQMKYTLEDFESPSFTVAKMWRNESEWLQVMAHIGDHHVGKGQQWELKTKDNRILKVIASYDTITINDDLCIICVCKDMTDLLETESQLRQVQKMEAIGSLASGIAHDFNNILAVIMGYAELLDTSGGLNNEQRSDLAELQKGCKRARDLVRQILSFSRQTEQEMRPLQVKIIVKEVLKMLRATLPSTIKIQQNLTSDENVLGDPTQIYQVLMNLCTNSYHAMEESGGVLTVNLYDAPVSPVGQACDSPNCINIEVGDTGSGIPEFLLEKIFEPYFTTKSRGKGTGLGLSIVKKIIESHGGSITLVHSSPQGTMFRVALPTAEMRSARGMKRTDVSGLTVTPCHILFVDDETVLLSVYRRLLKSVGYEVTTVDSGVMALDLLTEKPDDYQIVITDLTMPNMTGLVLAREIRNLGMETPIILTTGYSEKLNNVDLVEYGINDVVLKPPIIRDLVLSIEKLLNK